MANYIGSGSGSPVGSPVHSPLAAKNSNESIVQSLRGLVKSVTRSQAEDQRLRNQQLGISNNQRSPINNAMYSDHGAESIAQPSSMGVPQLTRKKLSASFLSGLAKDKDGTQRKDSEGDSAQQAH